MVGYCNLGKLSELLNNNSQALFYYEIFNKLKEKYEIEYMNNYKKFLDFELTPDYKDKILKKIIHEKFVNIDYNGIEFLKE
jgi:hypothetical protein